MPRNRSAGIVIKDGKLLLMHRFNKGREYWVFPGGGVEKGETPAQAAVREIYEETTIDVTINKLLYQIKWDTGEQNYFYLCEYVSGEPRLHPDSVEVEEMKGGEQVYEPMWVEISKLSSLTLYQLEIRDLFLADYQNNFDNLPQELNIKFSDRREK